MKVRASTTFVVGRFGAKKGEVLDVSDKDAAELIRVGVAEYVSAPAQNAQEAPQAQGDEPAAQKAPRAQGDEPAAPKAKTVQRATTKRTGSKK